MAHTPKNKQNNTKARRTPRRNRHSEKTHCFLCFSDFLFLFIISLMIKFVLCKTFNDKIPTNYVFFRIRTCIITIHTLLPLPKKEFALKMFQWPNGQS